MFRSSVSKTRRPFGQPVSEAKGTPKFYPIPRNPPQNLAVPIDSLLPGIGAEIEAAGKLVFHAVGDTGGINGDEMQKPVAQRMETQFQGVPQLGKKTTLDPAAAHGPAPEKGDPSFFYHLGDVVYYNGEEKLYGVQFYEPYQFYPAAIFAVPGNHDGDNHPSAKDDPQHLIHEQSLEGFLNNFCDSQPRQLSPYRPTVTQPYPYWTLETPYATIIGLYSNVDGLLDPVGGFQQQAWYQAQLKSADANKCLLVAVHHPPYSLDTVHGGYPDILVSMDDAAKAAGRWPDAVFTGHVHNYQRFTRKLDSGAQVPHVVAGSGGYANAQKAMHKLQRDPAKGNQPITGQFATDVQGVTLESYNEVAGGFLRITADDKHLTGEYFAVPFTGAPPADAFDSFTLDWRAHKITASSPGFAPDGGAQVPTHPKRVGAGKIPHGWPPTGPRRNRKPAAVP